MILKSFAAGQVVACELFAPMAKAARRAIASNGYREAITVLTKRSDEIVMGE